MAGLRLIEGVISMIRYRRLYESKDSNIKLYDTVRCGDYEWFVINVEGDIITLLAKNLDFWRSKFGQTSNVYKNSTIRRYLKSKVLPKLESNGVRPIPTRLNDVGCTDKVWLLSLNEAEKLPKNIREFFDGYWLRSPGSLSNIAADVDSSGFTNINGRYVDSDSGSVRPAIRVHVEDLD